MSGNDLRHPHVQRLGAFFLAVAFGSLGLGVLPMAIKADDLERIVIGAALVLFALLCLTYGLRSPRAPFFKTEATRRQRRRTGVVLILLALMPARFPS